MPAPTPPTRTSGAGRRRTDAGLIARVDASELARAKAQFKASLFMARESALAAPRRRPASF